MGLLQGKVAIITGASAGIGLACARMFAAEGATLVLGARRGELLAALCDELSNGDVRHSFLAGDVRDAQYAEALVALASDNYGHLDIAINNAGTLCEPVLAHDMAYEEWQRTLDTNLGSAFLSAKYQLPAMMEAGGGSIVMVSSFIGYSVCLPEMSAYAASKAGLIGLSKALAVDYADHNIRVNALLPGGTETAMGAEAAPSEEQAAFVRGLHAMKRIAQPEEIAKAALYLASDAGSFTTGSAMLVDGGVSISKV